MSAHRELFQEAFPRMWLWQMILNYRSAYFIHKHVINVHWLGAADKKGLLVGGKLYSYLS